VQSANALENSKLDYEYVRIDLLEEGQCFAQQKQVLLYKPLHHTYGRAHNKQLILSLGASCQALLIITNLEKYTLLQESSSNLHINTVRMTKI
jgi:hypothetical protein